MSSLPIGQLNGWVQIATNSYTVKDQGQGDFLPYQFYNLKATLLYF